MSPVSQASSTQGTNVEDIDIGPPPSDNVTNIRVADCELRRNVIDHGKLVKV